MFKINFSEESTTYIHTLHRYAKIFALICSPIVHRQGEGRRGELWDRTKKQIKVNGPRPRDSTKLIFFFIFRRETEILPISSFFSRNFSGESFGEIFPFRGIPNPSTFTKDFSTSGNVRSKKNIIMYTFFNIYISSKITFTNKGCEYLY